ncbi:MAG: hypothetical protein ABI995_14175, partial [Acidobacteriota bacterium]
MRRDEARKLMGGYATGSLTDVECALLFEAALDDQELFDELAGEQSLKELLDSPGAKDRLLAGLRPVREVKPAWWAQPWPWAAAAGLSVAAALVWVMLPRAEAPVQVAENKTTTVALEANAPAIAAPIVAEPVQTTQQGAAQPELQRQNTVAPTAAVAPAALAGPAPQEIRIQAAAAPPPARAADAVTVTTESPLLKTESATAADAG